MAFPSQEIAFTLPSVYLFYSTVQTLKVEKLILIRLAMAHGDFGLPKPFGSKEGRYNAIVAKVPPKNKKWVYNIYFFLIMLVYFLLIIVKRDIQHSARHLKQITWLDKLSLFLPLLTFVLLFDAIFSLLIISSKYNLLFASTFSAVTKAAKRLSFPLICQTVYITRISIS